MKDINETTNEMTEEEFDELCEELLTDDNIPEDEDAFWNEITGEV